MYGGNPDYVSGTGTIASLYFLAKLVGEYDIDFVEESTSLRKSIKKSKLLLLKGNRKH